MDNLFLDLETVPAYPTLAEATIHMQECFRRKFQHEHMQKWEATYLHGTKITDEQSPDEYWETFWQMKAPLHTEFNKIVCCAVGSEVPATATAPLRFAAKPFVGTEKGILMLLSDYLDKYNPMYLVAHNGNGFDLPMLWRKYMVYGLKVPTILFQRGKKPWEIPWIDTQDMWGCGQWKYFVALDTLAMVFGLPSPKDGVDGSQVHKLYLDGKIREIGSYCCGDVVTCAQVKRKMEGLPIYENIIILN